MLENVPLSTSFVNKWNKEHQKGVECGIEWWVKIVKSKL
jgi:hypothetical protein